MLPVPSLSSRAGRFAILALVSLCLLLALRHDARRHNLSTKDVLSHAKNFFKKPHKLQPQDVTLVIASTRDHEIGNASTDWVEEFFPDWNRVIYVVDQPLAEFTVVANKGHEGMVYLSYIIDNYDKLSPITIFHHARRWQWHSEDPMWDGARQLRRLNLTYVQERGYANLRCSWQPGCPMVWTRDGTGADDEIAIFNHTAKELPDYFGALMGMFPDVSWAELPMHAGSTCCAEFAMTRETIRNTPKLTWIRARRWLLETPIKDPGVIMEYTWHLLAGQPHIDCPNAYDCYCKMYGRCALVCETEGRCNDYWREPGWNGLPPGWPEKDWAGDAVDWRKMLNETEDIGKVVSPPKEETH